MRAFIEDALETLPGLPLVKTDYKPRGFWFRLGVDLFLSNLGLLLGGLTTVFYWTLTWEVTRQDWFRWVVFEGWLGNVPILTVACLLGYILGGLYRGTHELDYTGRARVVLRAVGLSFILFFALVRLTDAFIPRSTLLAGWVYILGVMLASRFFAKAFYRRYHLLPSDDYDPQIDRVVRELTLMSHQDGWLPPESLPRRAPWPHFEKDEVVAAAAVLQSGKVNPVDGKRGGAVSKRVRRHCGVNHAIALANGTLALELALKTLGIGPGDEVIVTPRTFIASASCASMVGAKPVFVDVDRDSQNIDPQAIRAAITPATRAIVAVHLAGWPCDMDPIMALAEEHGLKVIEDCAQSHGAVYYSRTPGPASAVESLETIRRDGVTLYPRMTGSLGHMAAFSFCQDKIMTTGGEGGMLLTNDDALRDRIMNAVVAKGAPCFSGSCSEVYLEKAFDRDGLRPARRLPVARELGQTSLMFMVHPTLAQKDMEQVAEAVRAVMAEAGR
jgi:dTDP-4-amino-4,6-dideoxygalactose transaminase